MPHINVNPVDGAIYASGISIGAHHKKAWDDEVQRVHRLRGEVLSTVVELESSIDYAIGSCLLPRATLRSPGIMHKRHDLLQNEILTRFEFSKKIEIMQSLFSLRYPRKRERIERLTCLLNSVRGVRNHMAHSPVYFEALAKPVSGRWLRPHLTTAKGMVHLSDGYLRQFKRNSLEAVVILRELLRLGVRQGPPVIE